LEKQKEAQEKKNIDFARLATITTENKM